MWALDHLANRVCLRIHRGLNALTGWSNFRMARIAINLGTILDLFERVLVRSPGVWGGLRFSFGIIFSVAFWSAVLYTINLLEKAWTSETGITKVPLPFQAVKLILWMRLMHFYLGAFLFGVILILAHVPIPNSSLLQGMSLYFAFQWLPPRKTVFREAFDSAKEAASKIPSLLPSPTPIPVPS